MKVRYFAVSDEGMRNGTFVKLSSYGYSHYILGDFQGFRDSLPEGYRELTAKESREILPKGIR